MMKKNIYSYTLHQSHIESVILRLFHIFFLIKWFSWRRSRAEKRRRGREREIEIYQSVSWSKRSSTGHNSIGKNRSKKKSVTGFVDLEEWREKKTIFMCCIAYRFYMWCGCWCRNWSGSVSVCKTKGKQRKLKASFLKILHAFMYDPFYEFFEFDFCIWICMWSFLAGCFAL